MCSEQVPRYDADYHGGSLERWFSVKGNLLFARHTLDGRCQLSPRMTRDQLKRLEADLWGAVDNLRANKIGILSPDPRQVPKTKLQLKLWK